MKTLHNKPTLSAIKQVVRLKMSANKVQNAYLFGSYTRGENVTGSDIDVAVDMEADADLLDLVGFKQDLEEELGVEVDVTTRRSINSKLKSHIEKDIIKI